jgi:3-oxoacyl-[acyl-carrier protein] reductase
MTAIGLFKGERALVTGSASNIGRAIAEALAREGAHVVLADIDEARNAATLDAIGRSGGSAEAAPTDLSGKEGWRGLMARLDGQRIDMLVHAAAPPRREVDHVKAVSEDVFDAMLNVNVRSGFLLARALCERMRAGGIKGRLLFITSLHAESPRNLPHYSASKAGQTMLVKELARAYGPHGIRINALAPGAIPGGGFNAAAFDFSDKIAMGRLGNAEDLAGPALALLSDRFSRYVTGTTLVVDGGLDLFNWIKPPVD